MSPAPARAGHGALVCVLFGMTYAVFYGSTLSVLPSLATQAVCDGGKRCTDGAVVRATDRILLTQNSCFVAAGLLASGVMAAATDALGRKRVLVLQLCGIAGLAAAFGLFRSTAQLVGLSAALGPIASQLVVTNTCFTVIRDFSGNDSVQLGRWYVMLETSGVLGGAVGLPLFGYLSDTLGPRNAAAVACACALVIALGFALGVPESAPPPPHDRTAAEALCEVLRMSHPRQYANLLFYGPGRAKVSTLLGLMWLIPQGSNLSFVLFMREEFGFSAAKLGVVFLGMGFCAVSWPFLAVRFLQRRWSATAYKANAIDDDRPAWLPGLRGEEGVRVRFVCVGVAFAMVAFVLASLLSFLRGVPVARLAILAAVSVLYQGIYIAGSSLRAWLSAVCPADKQGMAMGANGMLETLAYAIGYSAFGATYYVCSSASLPSLQFLFLMLPMIAMALVALLWPPPPVASAPVLADASLGDAAGDAAHLLAS